MENTTSETPERREQNAPQPQPADQETGVGSREIENEGENEDSLLPSYAKLVTLVEKMQKKIFDLEQRLDENPPERRNRALIDYEEQGESSQKPNVSVRSILLETNIILM